METLESELRLLVLWVGYTNNLLCGVKERTDWDLEMGLACVCRNEAVLYGDSTGVLTGL